MSRIILNTDYLFDGDANSPYLNKNHEPSDFKRDMKNIRELIIHCTATDSKAFENPAALINYDIHPNHISRKGCPFATCHFYVNKAGDIFQLVDMKYYCWHTKGHNQYSLAVCINHAGIKDNVTDKQYSSLIECIIYIFDYLGWEISEESLSSRLHFHREYARKLCPGRIDKLKLIGDILNEI